MRVVQKIEGDWDRACLGDLARVVQVVFVLEIRCQCVTLSRDVFPCTSQVLYFHLICFGVCLTFGGLLVAR